MKFYSALKLLACLLVSLLTTSCVAQEYETWTEQMTCGEAQYKLVSICKPSNAEMELNECKAQALDIVTKGKVRKVKLPELDRFSKRVYKEAFGDPSELFVVQWGCGHDKEKSVLTLYYSTGGGHAESFAEYDNQGKIIEHEKSKSYGKAMNDSFSNLKRIRSIMPD